MYTTGLFCVILYSLRAGKQIRLHNNFTYKQAFLLQRQRFGAVMEAGGCLLFAHSSAVFRCRHTLKTRKEYFLGTKT